MRAKERKRERQRVGEWKRGREGERERGSERVREREREGERGRESVRESERKRKKKRKKVNQYNSLWGVQQCPFNTRALGEIQHSLRS
jgi:hypothetical protein